MDDKTKKVKVNWFDVIFTLILFIIFYIITQQLK